VSYATGIDDNLDWGRMTACRKENRRDEQVSHINHLVAASYVRVTPQPILTAWSL
jgi:hypothetical protein